MLVIEDYDIINNENISEFNSNKLKGCRVHLIFKLQTNNIKKYKLTQKNQEN